MLSKRETLELAEPVVAHRWAIIGPYGNIWTPTLFDKPEEAEDHLRRVLAVAMRAAEHPTNVPGSGATAG